MKPYYLALSLSKQNRLMKQILILVAAIFISIAVSAQRPMPTAEVGTLDGKKVNLQNLRPTARSRSSVFGLPGADPAKLSWTL